MTNDILINKARETTEGHLRLLREEIRERIADKIEILLELSQTSHDLAERGRLIEKAAALTFVNHLVGEDLAKIDSIEAAHTQIDNIETWGMTAVSDGFRQGCMLVVGYINEYLR
jgi:predicted metal-dependent phosphoesterase TrpH